MEELQLGVGLDMAEIGQTLGFALAKGLIRGLTRCQPAIEILTYYLFLDVS